MTEKAAAEVVSDPVVKEIPPATPSEAPATTSVPLVIAIVAGAVALGAVLVGVLRKRRR